MGGKEYAVQEVSADGFKDVDLAFFAAGGSVSKEWVQPAVDAGAVVIDNTSAFRLRDDVPLIVPEINGEDIFRHRGIISNPNCSTIIMALVLKPILDRAGIKRVVVSTYQAVSGGAGGRGGMDELRRQTEDYVMGRELQAEILPFAGGEKHYPIAFNVLPQIDDFDQDGYTKEEWKMVKETQKMFGDPDFKVSATAIRIPVMRSHSESINVETIKPLSPEECRRLLAQAPGIEVIDDVAIQDYPPCLFILLTRMLSTWQDSPGPDGGKWVEPMGCGRSNQEGRGFERGANRRILRPENGVMLCVLLSKSLAAAH